MNNNFIFKKRLGQNFLINENILDQIIDNSDIEEESLVIEVGCGSGNLTRKLSEKFKYVLGYEIDKDLEKSLNEINNQNTNIIFEDFLKRDIKRDISNYKYDKLYVISNLPYYITTPIIEKIIESKIDPFRIIVMVQKEVGDRIKAKPNSKQYSSLSIYINYYFEVKKILEVKRGNFYPQPNVDSIVLKMSRKDTKEIPINEELFFKLVRDSFKFKRKTLKNNLIDYDFAVIEEVLKENGYKENIRAEQISIDLFIKIANSIYLNNLH